MKFSVATLFLAAIFGMAIAAPVKREDAAVASTEGAFEEEKTIVVSSIPALWFLRQRYLCKSMNLLMVAVCRLFV